MKLKEVQNILNYQKSKKSLVRKPKLSKRTSSIRKDFEDLEVKRKPSKYLAYLTIITFLFFIIAIGIAIFVSLSGIDNEYSPEKILLVTDAPTTVDSAEIVPFNIRIINRNPVSLNRVNLTVIYPEGLSVISDSGIIKKRQEFQIGNIDIGEVVNTTIRPSVYGQSNEQKTVQYELEYRAEGSHQSIVTKRDYTFTIRNSPVTLSPIRHTAPIVGKEMSIEFDIQSILSQNVKNITVLLQHPVGFLQTDTNVNTVDNITRWDVPILERGKKKTFTLSGIIQDGFSFDRSMIARVLVGPGNIVENKVVVSEKKEIFTIESSFLEVSLNLGGHEGEKFIIEPSRSVRGKLNWKNIDTEQLEGMVITLELSGSGLDQSSIKSPKGYFDDIQKRIVWDSQGVDDFALLPVNESGSFEFSFKALPNRPEFSQENKYIQLDVSVSAFRVNTSTVEELKNVTTANIALSGVLQVAANTLYSTSEIRNTGPVPPTVGERTTYVLQYFIKNGGNDITDFTMTVPLGRDVEFSGQTVGGTEREISYDEKNHNLLINIDRLSAYGPESSRSIEAQVIVVPTDKFIRRKIPLTRSTTYTAFDTHTEREVQGDVSALSTYVKSEPLGSEREQSVRP